MNVPGYSIFNHAQFGNSCRTEDTHCEVINAEDEVGPQSADASISSKLMKHRNKPERGCAVELGLGLGPQFNRRKTNE